MGGVASTSNVAIRKLEGLELLATADSVADTRALVVNMTQATKTKSLNMGIAKLDLLENASAENAGHAGLQLGKSLRRRLGFMVA